MSEQPGPQTHAADVLASLHELALYLRQVKHLSPDAQEAVADLVDELSQSLKPDALPSAETAHLAGSVSHLVQALEKQQDPTLLTAAKERLEDAAYRAEAKMPNATGLAHRLLETLSQLGI